MEEKIHFDDIISAFGGIKQANFKDKGKYACRISRLVFEELGKAGVDSWYLREEGERDLICMKLEKMPLQFIVRNRMVGTLAHLVCQEEGFRIPNVIHELRYLNKDLCNPMINDDYAVALGLASYDELGQMREIADKSNAALKHFFHKAGIELVDFKLEFGKTAEGRILVACCISPDNCRLWDEESGRILDKDRFRQDLSDVCASYREVMERL